MFKQQATKATECSSKSLPTDVVQRGSKDKFGAGKKCAPCRPQLLDHHCQVPTKPVRQGYQRTAEKS
jgi:hypothetical protein